MVFLGGAVLANIVRFLASLASTNSCSTKLILSADGRQRKHVDIKAGMGGTGSSCIRETWGERVMKILAFL
jgi:sulfopyruvate decarboxylase TPP-binding subunit